MPSVLVLNATFEPLTVVSTRRAVCLVLAQKVETVHESDEAFRSERLIVGVPSVVRLDRYVAVPHQRRRAPNRRAVFVRDRHRCQYCDASAETLDHVTPRSRGGTHSWENVVAACLRCNAVKRDRLLAETTMRLRRTPTVPPPSAWVEVVVGSIPASWEPYLRSRQRRSA